VGISLSILARASQRREGPPTTRPRSKKDRIYQALRHEILTLGLVPGRVLVEGALARRFRASKTPVREALACLAQDGLVEILPRRGYLVTAVTVRDLHELFELRAALEGQAAELAAGRITAEELAALERLLVAPETLVERRTLRRFLDRNRRFHLAIARASRNGRLERLIARTMDEMARLIAIGYETGHHAEIVAALRSGDARRARAAAVEHILLTQERVLKREIRTGE
jgi:DNA-binding GntR family transcriptional regulator